MTAGRLCVISGPSGAGKGTVVTALRERVPDLFVSVSATTRPRRPNEVDGVHYRFLTPEAFDELIAAGGLLEWAEFGGWRYGTPAAPVHTALQEGRTVVLEIDVQGAHQVRDLIPDADFVFLSAPDVETLGRRLHARGTEEPTVIRQRLEAARAELADADWFEHTVVNDDVDRAAEAIARILER